MRQPRYPTRVTGRVPRRRLLQTSLPISAVALAIACGGGSSTKKSSSTGGNAAAGGTPSTGGAVASQAGAVDVIKPGHYFKQLAASKEELNAATTAKRGGTFKFLYLDPPHFDPSQGFSCTIYDTMSLVYNKLARAKLGPQADPAKLEIEPDLAEKWEQTAPDATEFTFHIRKGVKYQNVPPTNGRAFDVQDVKYAFEHYMAGGVQKDFFSMVDHFETPDQYTLVAKLKEPYVDFPATIATYSYILPHELWESGKAKTDVAGTGPFIRETWTPKQGSTFKRNPDYWELGADGKPLPYVDAVETFVVNEPATWKAGYQSGRWYAYYPTNTADGEDLMKSIPNTVWLDLPTSRGGNVNGFQFKMDNPKFKDKRVRNAISMGIDRVAYDQLLNDGLNQGYSDTALPWPAVFDSFPTLKDQGPTYQYNPGEAKKMLQAAGAENLEFTVIEFYLTSGVDAFSPAQDMLRQIGVTIKDQHVDNPTAITILAGKKFDEAVNMVWGPPNHSIDGWIYPWYITGGGLNYNNVSNPDLDNLLKAQRKETDAGKRRTILKQVYDLLNDQNYEVWWPQAWVREMWSTSVRNYRDHGFLADLYCYDCQEVSRLWIAQG